MILAYQPYTFFVKLYYMMKGYRIGKHSRFYWFSRVSGKKVKIGRNFLIGFWSRVNAAEEINIGDDVQILKHTDIGVSSVTMGDGSRILQNVDIGDSMSYAYDTYFKIGKNSLVCKNAYINCAMPVNIGDDVGIGHRTMIFTHGIWKDPYKGYPIQLAPVTIGDRVWVATRCSIFAGVTINDDAVVGADSLVIRDVAKNNLVAGVPAKIIKENANKEMSSDEREKLLVMVIERAMQRRSNDRLIEKIRKTMRDLRIEERLKDVSDI
jgi:acetyltransferase-like isoleucine patch superfamily enzyme